KFRSLIEQAAVAVIVFKGEELRIDAVNPRMQELLGKEGELIGKTLLEAVPELSDQKPYELLHKVYQTGETFNGYETPVTMIRNGQKEVGYFNFTYTPLIENGEVAGIIDMAVEVTEQVRANRLVQQLNEELASSNADLIALNEEISATNGQLQTANHDTALANSRLRESEESLRVLADNISQLAWMADGDGYIFWYNKRWYDYTGTSIEEMRGTGWHTVHHPEHMDRVVEKYNRIFAEGKVWEDLFPLRGKDDSYRWFLSRAVPLKDANGNVLRWFGTNTDVTEQREDEQRKNDFIAMVSHELKTPLTSANVLVQMLQLLTKSDDNPKIAELLEKSKAQLSKMNSMITGFLDVSRFEAGKIYLQNQTFSFGELVRDTVADTELTSTTHQILIKDCPDISVTADRDKIGQVIYNLLSNAIKYSPRNSIIEVGCAIENGMAEFRVRDNGMGIGKKDMEKLFERFYRVERQETERITGFGIGLYLCAEIIHRHKGKIWVESEQDNGSTFYFAIPLTA
ncbi:MAG: PAS domain S-box protein, partial [Pedobacter sp.]